MFSNYVALVNTQGIQKQLNFVRGLRIKPPLHVHSPKVNCSMQKNKVEHKIYWNNSIIDWYNNCVFSRN